MKWEAVAGLVRHALTFGGGFLTTAGIADAATVETGVGALVTLIGVVWSVWAKKDSA